MHRTAIQLNRSPLGLTLRSGAAVKELPRLQPQPQQQQQQDQVQQLARQLEELRSLQGHLEATLSELQEQQRTSLQELQLAAVELATETTSWLVGTAIDRNLFAVDDLVANAVEALDMKGPIEIRLHPEDCRLLESLMEREDAAPLGDDVTVVPDSSLARGICRAESPKRSLLGDWKNRLEDIHRNWLESLNDTQVERRADDPHGRGFRRFPDRRETA
jgi:flagellar biosynthesis/type III secretory pathway protein FliH